MNDVASQRFHVLLSGLPGRMCSEAATVLFEYPEEFDAAPWTMTGPEFQEREIEIAGRRFEAVRPSERNRIETSLDSFRPLIALDFTLPSAIEENLSWYCKQQIPFVMGTTGGNASEIARGVEDAGLIAVVAPNMAIPIVMIQAAARWLSESFPSALTGYDVEIRESHQSGKKDVSGTAKAIAEEIRTLGAPIRNEDIQKIRDPQIQRQLGAPEEYLGGHAYHTYRLHSPDGTVDLSLTHNILGRRVYAEGAIWALRFLRRQALMGDRAHCYNMMDVLRTMQRLLSPSTTNQ